jgi:hypothetical protein
VIGDSATCTGPLRETVEAMFDSELPRIPGGSTISNAFILTRPAAHDVYHAGQIQLVKKLSRGDADGGRLRGRMRQRRS